MFNPVASICGALLAVTGVMEYSANWALVWNTTVLLATLKASPEFYARRGGDPLRRLPAALKTVPLVVLVLIFQRKIISGLTAGGEEMLAALQRALDGVDASEAGS